MTARSLLAPLYAACLLLAAAATQPASVPASRPARPEGIQTDIVYGKAGDVSLCLDAWTHSDATRQVRRPVVILVHGGGWSGGDKQEMDLFAKPLAEGGFAWFSVNYRLAPAHRWPACYEDLQTAIRWVKANAARYQGDPERIALLGYSAGGQLVCLSALQAAPETRVQAVVGLSPPTDFEQDLPQRGGLSKSLQALLDRPKEVSDESRRWLKALSPIHHIHDGAPPFLLMQGDVDKTVPYQQTLNFQARLQEHHVPCTLMTIKGAPHAMAQWESLDGAFKEKIVAWLQQTFLAPSRAAPAAR